MSEEPMYFRKQLRALVPHGSKAEEVMASLKPNELVRVKITRPRNAGQHRLYWEMCRLVSLNHEELKDAEMVHQTIKILVGHCDVIKVADQLIKIPRSISFSAMPQEEFDRFLSAAKDAVTESLLPGVDDAMLMEEILRIAT